MNVIGIIDDKEIDIDTLASYLNGTLNLLKIKPNM